MISRLCSGVEFWARFCFVNIPSALLAKFPEIDRLCSLAFAYLLFQVVGFCWAFLVNAAFAISCQASSFLPLGGIGDDVNTIQLVASFYFVYSSARVVITFAKQTVSIALQSLQDFSQILNVLLNIVLI